MTDSRVYTPAQPWYPPATPVEFPEGRLTPPAWVGKVAKSKHGDIVIRSHLVPRHPPGQALHGRLPNLLARTGIR